MLITRSMLCVTSLSLLLLGVTAGCSKSEPAAPKLSASGAMSPDKSADRCKLIPPEMIAEYERLHDVFSGAPGLEPQFVKGQLFHDKDVLSFKWNQVSAQPLTVSVQLLRQCSVVTVHGSPLREEVEGSGVISTPLYTSNSGSSYPSGTPAVVQVESTVVDSNTMTGKTTVIGEYTIRLEGPKD